MATKRSRLDDKVDHLRSQKMSFTNDGFEISLDVPDSRDVRETFAVMVDTVIEQETEISELNNTLDRVNQHHKSNAKKMLQWTARSIEELRRQNAKLAAQLNDANNKIKNLSYNVQGYVDDEENDLLVVDPAEDIAPALSGTVDDTDIDMGESVLFSTEEGGDPAGGKFGILLERNPKNDIRKFSKFKTEEERNLAKKMYHSVRFNSIPEEARKRWRWAINKVVTVIRIRDAKIGLTRTRLDSSQTFSGQLDRLKKDLYTVPIEIRAELQTKAYELHQKLDATVYNFGVQQSTTAEKLDRVSDKLDESVSDLTGDVTKLTENLDMFVGQLQQATSGESQKLRDAIVALETQVRDSNDWEIDRLRKSMDAVVAELNQMEVSADGIMQKLDAISTMSAAFVSSDSESVNEISELVDLLQLDTRMREARAEYGSERVNLEACNRQYETIAHEAKILLENFNRKMAISPRGKGNVPIITNAQLQELDALISRCTGIKGHIQHIKGMNVAMERVCVEHDKRVEQKYSALLTAGASSNNNNSSNNSRAGGDRRRIRQSQSQSMDEHDAEVARVNAAIDPQTQAILGEFAMRLSLVESMIPELNEALEGEEGEVSPSAAQDSNRKRPKSSKSAGAPAMEDSDTEADLKSSVVAAAAPASSGDDMPVVAASTSEASTDNIITVAIVGAASSQDQVGKLLIDTSGATASSGGGGGDASSTEARDRLGALPLTVPALGSGSSRKNSKWGKQHRNSIASQVVLEAKLRPMIERIIDSNLHLRFDDAPSDDDASDGVDGDGAGGINRQVSFAQSESQLGRSASGASSPNGSVDGSAAVAAPPLAQSPGRRSRSSRSVRSIASRQSDKGRGMFDPAYLIEDISDLKKQNRELVAEVQRLKDERVTIHQVQEAFNALMKAQRKEESQSRHMLAIADIERTVQEVVKELRNVKKEHAVELEQTRQQFHTALVSAVVSAVREASDQTAESIVNTRALCLGCGRDSYATSVPRTRPTSPMFFPQLSANSMPGPDVLRAGFKIPVRPLSPQYVLEPGHADADTSIVAADVAANSVSNVRSARSAGNLRLKDRMNISAVSAAAAAATNAVLQSDAGSILLQNSDVPLTITDSPAHMNDDDSLRIGFRDAADDAATHSCKATAARVEKITLHGMQIGFDPPKESVLRPKTSELKTVRHAHGNLDGEKVRPIYRKGMVGKKSMRAETAYAPERFDLPGNSVTQLRLDSLHANPSVSVTSKSQSALPNLR